MTSSYQPVARHTYIVHESDLRADLAQVGDWIAEAEPITRTHIMGGGSFSEQPDPLHKTHIPYLRPTQAAAPMYGVDITSSLYETAKEIESGRSVARKRATMVACIAFALLFILFHLTGAGAGSRLYLLLIPGLLFCLKLIFNLVKKLVLWLDLQISSLVSAYKTRRRYKRLIERVKHASGDDWTEHRREIEYEAEARRIANE